MQCNNPFNTRQNVKRKVLQLANPASVAVPEDSIIAHTTMETNEVIAFNVSHIIQQPTWTAHNITRYKLAESFFLPNFALSP